jgi:hypothetical protein
MVGQTLVVQEMPQDSGTTAGKARAGGESFPLSSTNTVTQQAQNTGRTSRLSCTRIDDPRQPLGEN